MVLTNTEVIMTLGFLVSLCGFAFGVWKWVEGKITAVRAEAKQDVLAVRESWGKALDAIRSQYQADMARVEARLEATRADCARREEIHGITDGLRSLGERFDRGMDVMHRRVDDLMKMRGAAGTAD